MNFFFKVLSASLNYFFVGNLRHEVKKKMVFWEDREDDVTIFDTSN